MTIGFILNGEDVVIRSDANVRLIDILRVNFGLLKTKAGCLTGKCGFCAVIFNGSVNHACLVPAFRLRGSEVITIEGFSQTYEYQDIMAGFAEAQLESCGYCTTSKVLNAGALLERIKRPSRQEILQAFSGIKCRCTDPEKLVEGIEKAVELRQRRLYGRSA
ncbi:MAG: 2Fe-2S iron-sulfur cluster binding domain-containing protein [Treponema sp.]|jgi:carbon-monoxide dehydrogenase small subunit|nr:2Fe-2S iron-sulfur cluster binding domain-containing protein [Treponema sp.]